MGDIWKIIPVVVGVLILGNIGFSQYANAGLADVIITDEASCLVAGGTFDGRCVFSGDLTIPEGESWEVSNIRFAVRNLTVEGELSALAEMDADFMTNRGTISTNLLISIGGDNFWRNDCGGTINLLENGQINFDAEGTNHGTINGDSTTQITTPLSSNTLFNSGTVSQDISLNKVSIQSISSPCPPDPICGDSIVNQASEQCDDGNLIEDDGCTNLCQFITCGEETTLNITTNECEPDVTQSDIGILQGIIDDLNAFIDFLLANFAPFTEAECDEIKDTIAQKEADGKKVPPKLLEKLATCIELYGE